MLHRQLAHVVRARQVGVDDRIPIFDRHHPDHGVAPYPGIIHENLKLFKIFLYILEKRNDIVRLGNIKLPEVEPVFVLCVGVLEFLCGGGIGTISGNHLSACGEKRLGHTPTDSARTAGHNNSLVFEVEIHDRCGLERRGKETTKTRLLDGFSVAAIYTLAVSSSGWG
jgi:hypothetical protein